MPPIEAWTTFYVVVGASSGSLTGLTFVVITLTTGRQLPGQGTGLGAFTTPIVVHFSAVFTIAAILSAPWKALLPPAVILGLCGIAGVAYVGVVLRRLRHVERYAPVAEDWVWYGFLPLVAYAALVGAATVLPSTPTLALFVVGAAMTLLLLLGIRNAWDVVTYLALEVLPALPRGDRSRDDDPDHAADEATSESKSER